MICDKFLIMVKSRSTITFVILTLSWCLELGKIFHLMTDTFLIYNFNTRALRCFKTCFLLSSSLKVHSKVWDNF